MAAVFDSGFRSPILHPYVSMHHNHDQGNYWFLSFVSCIILKDCDDTVLTLFALIFQLFSPYRDESHIDMGYNQRYDSNLWRIKYKIDE